MNIPYPTEIEVEQAIGDICDNGLKKPANLVTFLRDMVCNIGLKHIFYGAYDALIVSVFVFLLAGISLGNRVLFYPMSEAWLYAGVFALAPLLTMLFFSISFWKERENALYSQKMVCHYTVAHLSAFRMLVASVLGFVFTTGYVLAVCFLIHAPILQLLCVAYASVLLFSILMTQVMLSKGTFLSLACLNLAWILANGLGCVVSVDLYAALLRRVPTVIWAVTDFGLVVLLIRRFCAYIRRAYHAYG